MVEGDLVATSARTITGTGPMIVEGQSVIAGATGIDLEYLSSGDTADFTAVSGDIRVSQDLSAVDLVTASGRSISFRSLAGLSFGPLTATGGSIAVDLAGDALFNGLVQATGGFSLLGGGTATFNQPVDVQTMLTVDIAGLLSVTGLMNGTEISLNSSDIDIGANATIGSFARTLNLALQAYRPDAAMIVGGGDQTGAWSLSNTEFGRLRATEAIEFFKPGDANAPALEIRTLSARTQGGSLGRRACWASRRPAHCRSPALSIS